MSEADVRATKVPLLAVIGSEGANNMPDVAVLKKIRPELDVVIIQGATHNEPNNARARPEFTDAVRRFVSALTLGPPADRR